MIILFLIPIFKTYLLGCIVLFWGRVRAHTRYITIHYSTLIMSDSYPIPLYRSIHLTFRTYMPLITSRRNQGSGCLHILDQLYIMGIQCFLITLSYPCHNPTVFRVNVGWPIQILIQIVYVTIDFLTKINIQFGECTISFLKRFIARHITFMGQGTKSFPPPYTKPPFIHWRFTKRPPSLGSTFLKNPIRGGGEFQIRCQRNHRRKWGLNTALAVFPPVWIMVLTGRSRSTNSNGSGFQNVGRIHMLKFPL